MCSAFLHFQLQSELLLLLAFNRDELFDRSALKPLNGRHGVIVLADPLRSTLACEPAKDRIMLIEDGNFRTGLSAGHTGIQRILGLVKLSSWHVLPQPFQPTTPAHFWEDDDFNMLAGQDQRHGGSWLGVTRQARFAFVTSVREASQKSGLKSRGELVINFLRGCSSPSQYLLGLDRAEYPGYNLVVGDISTRKIAYSTNRENEPPVKLIPGVYGLSNGTLTSAWPKMFSGKAALEALQDEGLLNGRMPYDDVFERVLGSKQKVEDDAQLPRNGLPLEWERSLSSVFIDPVPSSNGTKYGTRSQTLLAIFRDGHAELRERTMLESGGHDEVVHSFEVDLSRHTAKDLARSRAASLDNSTELDTDALRTAALAQHFEKQATPEWECFEATASGNLLRQYATL